jgi:hypothetical protein
MPQLHENTPRAPPPAGPSPSSDRRLFTFEAGPLPALVAWTPAGPGAMLGGDALSAAAAAGPGGLEAAVEGFVRGA